ncbi:MAG TPA: hypothetical protein VFO25_02630 [Candidatus Eremiobacteraceae bacterium]|nr:hypothetical protein [Candidatus Eremiobacteraceae bacterium]
MIAFGKSASPDASATPTWTLHGPAFVTKMVDGHDGNVWYMDTYEHAYGRITPSNFNVLTSPYPDPTQIGTAIAPNPDGNIYIATSNGSTCHIYKVHPDLTVVDLIAPYACTYGADTMVSGYDQRLWLDDGSATITRITTVGVISTLTMPEQVDGIMRGNTTGRAMFIVGYYSGTLYRIAPDDSITSVVVGRIGPLATASDGYIWAAAGTILNPDLVRIDDNLGVKVIALGRPRNGPFAILPHKGTLIMPCGLYPDQQTIFRFNTTKEVSLHVWTDPAQEYLVDAIIAPDHNLWMTDSRYVYVGTLN